MELKDTVEMMQSEDYKERLKAEYYQTKIRLDKLRATMVKHDAGTLNFTFTCDPHVLRRQMEVMEDYVYLLAVRCAIEGVEVGAI